MTNEVLISRIKERLAVTGKTARSASLDAGLSATFIRNIMKGKSANPRSDTLHKLATALETTGTWLTAKGTIQPAGREGRGGATSDPQDRSCETDGGGRLVTPDPGAVSDFPAGFAPVPFAYGLRDFPIYAATEGGPGEIVVSTDPIDIVERPSYMRNVKDGYGVLVVGESMVPSFRPGQIAIVNPRLPPQQGRDIILIGNEEDGEFVATIKFLIRSEPHRWYVHQDNPARDFYLDKKKWPRGLRVVGKQDWI